ncbi:HNH endonuclease [Tessaracoccus massiliensis]|uniref:HNH endonuclease n=1 Tax=Tessaracoccus massiliensis TaxID=1522311 RepID=UPI0006932BC9|nr:HNH endonuclease [Tessaracoccus massiliensis]
MSRPANANGHQRRQIIKRVRAEETHCYLCDQPVDKTLGMIPGRHGAKCDSSDCEGCIPDPMRGEVDEVVPRARGGSPLQRSNVQLAHRTCNQIKSDRSAEEARAIIANRAAVAAVTAAPVTLVDW